MRSRDDVNSDDIAHGTRRLRSGFSGGAHGGHVATHERRDEATADDLPTRHLNLGRLDHGVASLDGGHEAAGFDHSEGIAQGTHPYGKEKEAVDAERARSPNEIRWECPHRWSRRYPRTAYTVHLDMLAAHRLAWR